MTVRRPALAGLLLAAGIGLVTSPIHAASSVTLPAPSLVGEIDADTYDEDGLRVGKASLNFKRLANGHYLLHGVSGIEDSAQADVRAELVPLGDNGRLRLVHQQSESRDLDGKSLGVMSIDHRARIATCVPPKGSTQEPVRVELPENDRVVNVPLNLLFQPLVTGEAEQIDFQVLLCRAGRLVDARAHVAQDLDSEKGRLVEVRYELDFGPLLSRLAAPFMPRLSLWFHDDSAGNWVAHRMPLFSSGPTVLVIRSGFASSVLGAGR